MALITQSFVSDGTTKAYTVSQDILSNSHARIDFFYDGSNHRQSFGWDTTRSMVLFDEAPTAGYIVNITISSDGTGLDTDPTNLSELASNLDVVQAVYDNFDNINTAAENIDLVNNLSVSSENVLYTEEATATLTDSNIHFKLRQGITGANGENGLTPNYEIVYNSTTGNLEYNFTGYTQETFQAVEEIL